MLKYSYKYKLFNLNFIELDAKKNMNKRVSFRMFIHQIIL